jgi:hypothetical protein
MTENFIKARYRRMGSKADGPPCIDIQGLVKSTTLGITPGTAYALRDALSAALEDYEIEIEEVRKR